MSSRAAKFFRLTAADTWILLEAIVLLVVFRVGLTALSFRTVNELAHSTRRRARLEPISPSRIEWAVSTAARFVPGTCSCLIRSLAASTLLLRRGADAEIRFGGAKTRNGEFQAHAWVESAGQSIGRGEVGAFTPFLAGVEMKS